MLGEVLYILRPLAYCFLMLIYGKNNIIKLCLIIYFTKSLIFYNEKLGVKSYKPYLVSLGIDFLRLILMRKYKSEKKSEKEEIANRNK